MIQKKARLSRFYFYSLFSKIALLSIILVISFTISLYFNFKNYSLDVVNKSNEKLLVQLSSNLNQINKDAVYFAATLSTNANSANLMYPEKPDIYDTMRAITEIDLLIQGIPFLDSAYIYNGKAGMFYSMGPYRTMRSTENFFDREIIHILENLDTKKEVYPIARRIANADYPANPQIDVYSYVVPEFFSGSNRIKNAVVLNVRLDWIYDSLPGINDAQPSQAFNDIIIMDKTGLVLGHSLKNLYLETISDKSYVKNILSASTKSGFFESMDEGIRNIVTYVYIQDLNWYMLSITPYDYVAASVNKVRNITLTIFVILTILAIFLAFILSRQLYTPVQLLWRKAEQMFGNQQAAKNSGEFDLIESYFAKAAIRLSDLENFKNSNIYFLREEFLKNILTNKLDSDVKEEKLHELSINLDHNSNLLLVLLKLDQYKPFTEKNNETDQMIYKFALSNIALEILAKSWRGVSADLGNDQIALILSMDDAANPADILVAELKIQIKEIQEVYQSYYALSFSAFISGTIQGIHNAHILYGNVLTLSNYRIVYGKGCILSDLDALNSHFGKYDISSSHIQSLLDALKLGKIDQATQNLDSLLTALKPCEYNNIMFSLSFISSSIFNTLSIIEKNSVLVFDIDFVSFNNRLAVLETLDDVKAEYLHLFSLVREKMDLKKESSSDTVVMSTIRHIEANYKQRDLCIDTLADVFNISAPYLGKIFREKTSRSISEYITDTRMEKAKDLLEHSPHTIDEIIDRIGWENKKYFYTIFKKCYGVTPSEYRLKTKMVKN